LLTVVYIRMQSYPGNDLKGMPSQMVQRVDVSELVAARLGASMDDLRS
jgi:hypothetical protein